MRLLPAQYVRPYLKRQKTDIVDARLCLRMLEAQLKVVKEQILKNDRRMRASARETELGRRLMEIPGVGPLLASAFVSTIADSHAFRSG